MRLKQFQNDSDSLKLKKIKEKKFLTEIRRFVVDLGGTLDLTMIYVYMKILPDRRKAVKMKTDIFIYLYSFI